MSNDWVDYGQWSGDGTSKYERRIREEEKRRLAEEYEALKENQERGDIDVEELKRQGDMEKGDYLQAPYDFNQSMQIGQYFASQGSPSFDVNPNKKPLTESQKRQRDKLWQRRSSGQEGSKQAGDILKKKGIDPTALPNFAQSIEMSEIYNRDKELYGEFDRLVEAARNSSGRKKKALLQRAGRIREQIESGKDPMTIGEVPGAAWEFTTGLLPDPKSFPEMAEHFTDLSMDFRAARTAASLSPIKHPVVLGAAAAGGVVLRRGGKKLIKEIFEKTIKPGGKYVDEVIQGIQEGAQNVVDTITAPIRTVQEVTTGGMFGSVGAWSDRADMAKQRLSMKVRIAGSGMGFKDGVFNFDDYLSVRSKYTEGDRRWFAGIFSTPVDYATYRRGFGGKISESAYLKRLKADFMETYTPEFLEKYGIKARDIQAHHIDALMASLPLYDGVEYLSKEWYHITGTLLKKNVNPGNVSENIKYLVGRRGWPKTPHGITHSYLDEIVGPDGQKLFTADVRAKMKTLKGPYTDAKGITHSSYREYMTKEWADITLQSNQIADQAAGVFNAMNADLLNLQPKDIDHIMSSLGKLQNNGLVKPELIGGRWQIGAKEMRELLFDIDFTENIGQHFLLADPKGLRALRIALQSDNPVSSYQAIRSTLPKQLRLFKDDKVKTLAKKSRRYNNPKWDVPDDVPPKRGEGEFPETGEGLDEFGNPL